METHAGDPGGSAPSSAHGLSQEAAGSRRPASARRRYLDWLRGVAVLIMIAGHALDSWTRAADRDRQEYQWAMIVAGYGAPIFLFLAGIALSLAAGSRLRKGMAARDAARRARSRGWQIFGLAFLFRLQSVVISGAPLSMMLKVDILNVMGLSMVGAALVWAAGRRLASKAAALLLATVAVAMLTPLIRTSPLLSWLPDPVEWYLRPSPGRTTFTLFPWAGFLIAGGALGIWLDTARTAAAERRLNLMLVPIGAAVAAAGYGASFLPPIYAQTDFWTSSPTFFFMRLGILIATLPLAYAWTAAWRSWSPLQEFGIASLFVYWIHVEMVYGSPSVAIHRSLTLEQTAAACLALTLLLFGLVKLKEYAAPRLARSAAAERLRPGGRGRGRNASAPLRDTSP